MANKNDTQTPEQPPFARCTGSGSEALVTEREAPDVSRRVYIASKTQHAERWRNLRAAGVNITATWIDEAGAGESADIPGLASRCVSEAAGCDLCVLYCEPGEILKGAFVELGAALAAGKPVAIVGTCANWPWVFAEHPLVRTAPTMEQALKLEAPLTPNGQAERTTTGPCKA